ncbi:hypothetical protein F441_00037 [Phytophthora nicotianae CJ01A1]|uniref:F-box domain-containing protein n=2 Tax=Phytophthora nicotianae TaxID=4792 RepID=W2M2A2_PHYNI|nr:hypothetical protein L915_00038 [Phytophthora nicotianae]ETL50752.1 hypothetical protein L916_00037 [Phytophthora nicotianae]ETM03797.1 hypothetical protein L917_00025 [Phytophthora nicotianae]ETP27414.1 hypothetical protein F441_00037 [Phytophthora nicotianae CJ01A1]
MSAVSAAGALLWMMHTLLQEHGWVVLGSEMDTSRPRLLESFAGNVNLLPAQRYQVSEKVQEDMDVHVRGLLVGSKLFAHFVSSAKSVQLNLKVSEFVKPRKQEAEDQGRVLYTNKWRCNLEILRRRLERNLFPEFSSDASVVTSDAELSRLPEPLLVHVGEFLNVPDFCRVTQTNKYLHQLQDSSELWQNFLLRDFPSVHPDQDPKIVYISHWTVQKRMEEWNQRHHERQRQLFDLLHQQSHWYRRRLPAPPLHVPMPPPFLPLGYDPLSLRPRHRPDLFDVDADYDMLRDPFGFQLDPLYPYFY